MPTRFPGLPLPLDREPTRGRALHNVHLPEAVAFRRLPSRLGSPEPGRLGYQSEPARIYPHVEVRSSHLGLSPSRVV